MLQAGFAAATSCRDTQASSKAGSRARVGSASEVMFIMLHQLHSPAKDPRQGNPCSGANKTPSSLLTAVLTKISSENCCSRDHQLTYARSANPKNCSKSTRPFSSLEWVGSGHETSWYGEHDIYFDFSIIDAFLASGHFVLVFSLHLGSSTSSTLSSSSLHCSL